MLTHFDSKCVPLFGGAIQTVLPVNFIDASHLRTIPDNQEVFLDSTSETSLIIELVELNPEVSNDEMLSYHVNQIMQENEAKNVNLIHFSNAYKFIDETQPTVPLYSQLATVYFTGTKFKASTSSSSSHPVSLLFGILRLPHVKTDLLMSLYFPNVTTLLPYHNDLFQLVFSSLRILDWGLFT